MKARNFRYIRPSSLDQACRILAEGGDAAVPVAGGQSLLAGLNMRLSAPKLLVDIGDLKELTGQSYEGGAVRLGALTRHAELLGSQVIQKHVPLLVRAAAHIGHVAIRNRGTIGGSLAYADPAAELPACAVALEAVIVARSTAGERRIAAGRFFTGLYSTALAERELIAAVEFPVPPADERTAILELARRVGDYAMAGIAARARVIDGALLHPRLVFFGVADGPVLAERAMAALAGGRPSARIAAAQAALDADLN